MFKKIIVTAFATSALWLGTAAVAASDRYQDDNYQNDQSTDRQHRIGNEQDNNQNHGNDRNQNNQDSRNSQDQNNRSFRNDRAQGYGHQRYQSPSEYRHPRGYRSHSWGRGERLPDTYRRHRYRIDYSDYGLREPRRGEQWVRVDNDVLLTVVETGLVIAVVQNLFY